MKIQTITLDNGYIVLHILNEDIDLKHWILKSEFDRWLFKDGDLELQMYADGGALNGRDIKLSPSDFWNDLQVENKMHIELIEAFIKSVPSEQAALNISIGKAKLLNYVLNNEVDAFEFTRMLNDFIPVAQEPYKILASGFAGMEGVGV